jgi:hypothetical protein
MDWEHRTLLAPAGESPFYRALGEPDSPLGESDKPAFSPQDAAQVIDLFAERGVAITHGRIYLQTDEGLQALRIPGQPLEFIRSPGSWGCWREDGEPWSTFVARSTAEARSHVDGVISSGLASGGAWVDLEWVTEDELTYFGIPSAALAVDSDLIASGERPHAIDAASNEDGIRVRWAGAARGSFYSGGLPADLNDLPSDAVYLSVPDRSRIAEVLKRVRSIQMLRASLVNNSVLEAIGRLQRVRMLQLYDMRVTSLEAISNMESLEYLAIHAVARAPDMTPLARMPKLRVLQLSGRAVDRFHDIATCQQLIGLHVPGGGPGATIGVESLAPVANLARLRVLRLGLTRVRDKSLRPLAHLKALRTLDVGDRRFPLEELAWLAATVTWLDHDIRSPFERDPASAFLLARCRKCNEECRVATRGPRRRWLCPTCQPKKVAEYVASWEMLLAAACQR